MTLLDHWLIGQEAATKARIREAMGRVIGAIRIERRASHLLNDPALAVDGALRASIGDAYLSALRHGATPWQAQEHAAAEMAEATAGYNERRSFGAERAPTSESNFLAFVHRVILNAAGVP